MTFFSSFMIFWSSSASNWGQRLILACYLGAQNVDDPIFLDFLEYAENNKYSQLGQKWVEYSWSALKVNPSYKFWVNLVKVAKMTIIQPDFQVKIDKKIDFYQTDSKFVGRCNF